LNFLKNFIIYLEFTIKHKQKRHLLLSQKI
jgi:hypothetical protein